MSISFIEKTKSFISRHNAVKAAAFALPIAAAIIIVSIMLLSQNSLHNGLHTETTESSQYSGSSSALEPQSASESSPSDETGTDSSDDSGYSANSQSVESSGNTSKSINTNISPDSNTSSNTTRNTDISGLQPTGSTPGRGAAVPYDEYEAEKGVYQGQLISGSRELYTQAAEASGRSAIKLNNSGDYVQWTAAHAANAIIIRSCIPDASNGGGITKTISLYVNGTFRQKLTLSSANSWLYGTSTADNGLSNDPKSSSSARHFFDDDSAMLAAVIPAGADVKLQMDADDGSGYTILDFIDLELVGSPIAQPANSLSITDYGADPEGKTDSTSAIRSCISAAISQKKSVYIPAGSFIQNSQITLPSNIAIQGAGMWYSKLFANKAPGSGNPVGFSGNGSGIVVKDLALFSNGNQRGTGGNGFNGYFGPGSIIKNIWVEHTTCGAWIGSSKGITDGMTVEGCRFWDTFADGINLCNSTKNTTVNNCVARGNGDDGFATWSATDLSPTPCQNNTFIHCTSSLQWRANAFAIYGGENNSIKKCVAADTLTYAGVFISSSFTPYPFGGTTTVSDITITRCGGAFWGNQHFGALWIEAHYSDIVGVNVSNVDIIDPTYSGIEFLSQTYDHAAQSSVSQFSNVTVNSSAKEPAVLVMPNSLGSAVFNNLKLTGSNSTIQNNSSGKFKITN